LLRATCGVRGLRINWFIVGILTNLAEHDYRPTLTYVERECFAAH
jgi:hypothetical protein